MRRVLFYCTFFLASSVMAQNLSTSRFHLVSMKCEPEEGALVETTPQSPPLDVDDPSTPGCNRWEINILTSGDMTTTQKSFEMPLLDINYGIGDNIQLKYEVPLEKTQTDANTDFDVGRTKVGLKYLFFEDEEVKSQLAVYPQIEMVTPGTSQSANTDADSAGSVVTLPLLFSIKVGEVKNGDVMMTANMGYNASSRSDIKDFGSAAVGLGIPILNKVSFMGELSCDEAFTHNSSGVRDELVKTNWGMIATMNKYLSLYGSVGRSLISSDQLTHTYALVGVRVLAGGLEK